MSAALVTNDAAAGSNGAATSAKNTTGANGIYLGVTSYVPNAAPTVSDSKSNTWTKVADYSDPGGVYRATIYYCENPTVGSGHTFSASGTSSFCSISMEAFSGMDTSSTLDKQNGAGDLTGPTLATGSTGTLSTANQILIALVSPPVVAANTVSIDSGFTITDQIAPVSGVNFGIGMAYLIVSATTAKNPVWTAASAGSGMVAVIATFKATGTTNFDADFSLSQTLDATNSATAAAVADTSFVSTLGATDTSTAAFVAALALTQVLGATDSATGTGVGSLSFTVTPDVAPSATGQSNAEASFASTLDLSATSAVTFFADFALAVTSALSASATGSASASINLAKIPGLSAAAAGQALAILALSEALALSTLATAAASAGLSFTVVASFDVSATSAEPTGGKKFLVLKIGDSQYLKLVIG